MSKNVFTEMYGKIADNEKFQTEIAPYVYTVGFFNFFTPFKWMLNSVLGVFKVVPRGPISSFGLKYMPYGRL